MSFEAFADDEHQSIVKDTDFGLRCKPDSVKKKHFVYVLTGGSALAIWNRYLLTLKDNRNVIPKSEISDELCKNGTKIVDWDIHYTTSDTESFYEGFDCKIGEKEYISVEIPYQNEKVKKKYWPEHIILRKIIGKLFSQDCDTPETCGLIDVSFPEFWHYEHSSKLTTDQTKNTKEDFLYRFGILKRTKLKRGKKDEENFKVEFTESKPLYEFPMPEGVSKQSMFAPTDAVWTLGIVNPMVALGTHLDALSFASDPFKHENFTEADMIAKNKRRVARVKLFTSLMNNKFNNRCLKATFKKDESPVDIEYPEKLREETKVFLKSKICNLLLENKDEEIENIKKSIKTVFDIFKKANFF